MKPAIAIGIQSFSKLRENSYFYIDKTHFIKEWWERGEEITLVARPRRFGKTLLLDTVKTFFSLEFAGRSDLFEGLAVWNEKKYQKLQGTLPVIYLSFATIKEKTFFEAKYKICSVLANLYSDYAFLLSSGKLTENELSQFKSISVDMPLHIATESLNLLAKYIFKYYNKKPIIIVDEYDTPLHEAWLNGYFDDILYFFRGLFNSTFKTNPWIERGLLTGITCISQASMFSDMNNLQIVTVTTNAYTDCFGFTEEEVFSAIDEYGFPENEKIKVKSWYDGFIFGGRKDIYNPWSITKYLSSSELDTYWADTSSNSLVSDLIQRSNITLKMQMESLLKGENIVEEIDEHIVFNRLNKVKNSVLSLLIASGYLKVVSYNKSIKQYTIAITNYEVQRMMEILIRDWFNSESLLSISYEFRKSLCERKIIRMNSLMNKISQETFSFFDMSGKEPERFYHGFVLGLIVDLKERYAIESNRESGFGRYDVMLFPLNKSDPGIVIEFKSIDYDEGENSLKDTAISALNQIEEKKYVAALEARGVPKERIFTYGFAFKGKEVLIEGGPL